MPITRPYAYTRQCASVAGHIVNLEKGSYNVLVCVCTYSRGADGRQTRVHGYRDVRSGKTVQRAFIIEIPGIPMENVNMLCVCIDC